MLPGHNLPFVGLRAHRRALRPPRGALPRNRRGVPARPVHGGGPVPVVFRRVIDDPHQMGFAFSEVLAHVNYMLRADRLRPVAGGPAGIALIA